MLRCTQQWGALGLGRRLHVPRSQGWAGGCGKAGLLTCGLATQKVLLACCVQWDRRTQHVLLVSSTVGSPVGRMTANLGGRASAAAASAAQPAHLLDNGAGLVRHLDVVEAYVAVALALAVEGPAAELHRQQDAVACGSEECIAYVALLRGSRQATDEDVYAAIGRQLRHIGSCHGHGRSRTGWRWLGWRWLGWRWLGCAIAVVWCRNETVYSGTMKFEVLHILG